MIRTSIQEIAAKSKTFCSSDEIVAARNGRGNGNCRWVLTGGGRIDAGPIAAIEIIRITKWALSGGKAGTALAQAGVGSVPSSAEWRTIAWYSISAPCFLSRSRNWPAALAAALRLISRSHHAGLHG